MSFASRDTLGFKVSGFRAALPTPSTMPLFERLTNLELDAESLRRHRYGVIDIREGRLVSIRLRPWPKLVSLPEVLFGQLWQHRRTSGDRCRVYYNQPRSCPNFLALKYIVSSRGTSVRSFFAALTTLDQIARIKNSDAILCEVTNFRVSERLLARMGWERHTKSRWRRNYIKRFYGAYPPRKNHPGD